MQGEWLANVGVRCNPRQLVAEPDNRREAVLHQQRDVRRFATAHHQNLRMLRIREAGCMEGGANSRSFGGVCDAKPCRTTAGENRSTDSSTMTVTVGLNDRKEGRMWFIGG